MMTPALHRLISLIRSGWPTLQCYDTSTNFHRFLYLEKPLPMPYKNMLQTTSCCSPTTTRISSPWTVNQ